MLTLLNEIDRKNLVGKTKSQSPDRYKKRKEYHALSYRGIDVDQLLKKDVLICKVPVGDYITVIEFRNILDTLKSELKKQPKPNLTLQTVIRTMAKVADQSDVLLDCSCPDFTYRFAYWATKYGYKYGRPETRPPKYNKTNKDDKKGSMCKHLTALLANKKWLIKVAGIISDFIHAYPDEVRNAMGLSEDEFYINTQQYHAGRARAYNKIWSNDNQDNGNENGNNDNGEEISAIDKVRDRHNLDNKDSENNDGEEELEVDVPNDNNNDNEEEELEVKDDEDNNKE